MNGETKPNYGSITDVYGQNLRGNVDDESKKKRKKRPMKSIVRSAKIEDTSSINVNKEKDTKTMESGKESEETDEHYGIPKALYLNPTPNTLPPIDTKTSTCTAATAVATAPALPSDVRQSPNVLPPIPEQGQPSSHQEKNGISQSYYKRPKTTLYFKDGKRRIDYVLAYRRDENDEDDGRKREKFEKGLEEAGLQLEYEPKEASQDGLTYFIKIHAPWATLTKYAEIMRVKMPIKDDGKHPVEELDDSNEDVCCGPCFSKLTCCCDPCRLRSQYIEKSPDFHTAEFARERASFFDIKDKETFFPNAERSRITYRILSETKYGPDKLELGILRMISQKIYDSAFPLHEGKHTSPDSKLPINSNKRRMLYWEWARWGRMFKTQPLDAIRRYFGAKVAIYFAWLGFYTHMLLYPTIVGMACFFYGVATISSSVKIDEVCDKDYETYVGNATMCPLCDVDCTYWKLSTSCTAAVITQLFDNNSTIFFAIFMSLWATLFLEFWKRRQFKLSYEWDLVDYDEESDLVRPEYVAVVTSERVNPVTLEKEPYLTNKQKYTRITLSLVTVLFWILVIVAAVFAVIVYRLAIKAVFAVSVDLSSLQEVSVVGQFATPQMLTTITASCLSLVVIMVLNKIYEYVARWLTNMELPRTQLEYDDSFTFKMFCFQFVNYYSYLFYVAFFKTGIAGYPGNYTYLGPWRWEQCDPGGCMYELSLQLIIIMLGKQLWNNCVEIVWPWAINKYRQYRSTQISKDMPDNEYTRWEQDFDLNRFTEMGLFYEYLEMIIQFGFVTLFACAFPLAPLFALLNNIIEIRLDANKFICELRRPLAQKCADIGAWFHLLEIIGTISVVTNAFTIAITSDAIPKMVYYFAYSSDVYGENTLKGFTNNSLAYFNTSDLQVLPKNQDPFETGVNVTTCRYRDYREDQYPYGLTLQYWHVIAARLAFVIAMEHVVFFLKQFFDSIIPDRPKKLQDQIKREHFLVKDMLIKAEAGKLHETYKNIEDEMRGKPTSLKPIMSSSFNDFSLREVITERPGTPL